MSAELRVKKLRGSGGYVMARVSDEQQTKGNLGGPDLFLAPIGRLDTAVIGRHFCNTCEKEFEGHPKIEFENPNEEVAENLVLAEKGQYVCNACGSVIAEYREFKKQDESAEVGHAKPLDPQAAQAPQPAQQASQPQAAQVSQPQAAQPQAPQPGPEPAAQDAAATTGSAQQVSSIEGRAIYDENANKVGTAKQVGIDSAQCMVLVIIKNDGTEESVPWAKIKKVGEVVLLGDPAAAAAPAAPGACPKCGFANKPDSKFCEECGAKL